jgi:hypothetical protein
MSPNLESFNRGLAISCIVLFFLSMTPFCLGVLAIENCLFIPCSPQKSMNYFDVNSPPLSNLKHLILKFIFVSTISLYILKCPNPSDFFLRNQNTFILVYSSITSMKYCSRFNPFVLVGPQRSVCTISNGFFIEYSFDLNLVLVGFPYKQCLYRVFARFEIPGISFTASFMLILTRLSKFM